MAWDPDLIDQVTDRVVSHAMTLGVFERVNGHEPKSAPGNGASCAVWVDSIGPIVGRSGLSSTSALFVVNARAYSSMLQEPQDAIDPNITKAIGALINAYSGDFTLGGLVRCVDLLGMSGTALRAQAGYLTQDGKLFRVMTVTVPIIINDVFDQAE